LVIEFHQKLEVKTYIKMVTILWTWPIDLCRWSRIL